MSYKGIKETNEDIILYLQEYNDLLKKYNIKVEEFLGESEFEVEELSQFNRILLELEKYGYYKRIRDTLLWEEERTIERVLEVVKNILGIDGQYTTKKELKTKVVYNIKDFKIHFFKRTKQNHKNFYTIERKSKKNPKKNFKMMLDWE